MENTYACSYVEVLEILKHIPQKEYEKIPKEKIEFYEKNKDKEYEFKYHGINTILMEKTSAIIVNLYKNYIATPEQKEKVEEILVLNSKKKENEKRKKYETEINFNPTKPSVVKETIGVNEEEKSVAMINNEPWYKKIWNKIVGFFKI